MPDDVPMIVTDSAGTSPIRYTPWESRQAGSPARPPCWTKVQLQPRFPRTYK